MEAACQIASLLGLSVRRLPMLSTAAQNFYFQVCFLPIWIHMDTRVAMALPVWFCTHVHASSAAIDVVGYQLVHVLLLLPRKTE